MTREVLLLVDALAREKNVEKDIVFIALELALAPLRKSVFTKTLMCASRSIARPAISVVSPLAGSAGRCCWKSLPVKFR